MRALLYFILILAPQGGVKNIMRGGIDIIIILVRLDINYIHTYIHITHETCLLRQVGLQYENIYQPKAYTL